MVEKVEENKMNEKKTKSPILVLATMVFLAIFIAFPPLFRVLYPKDEVLKESNVKKTHILSCETISFSENIKITSKVIYEDDVAVKNTITYAAYTPTVEDAVEGSDTTGPDMTAAQAIAYFKGIDGVKVTEGDDRTMVVLTKGVVNDNSEKIELSNYLLSNDLQVSYFEGQGFICSKIEL